MTQTSADYAATNRSMTRLSVSVAVVLVTIKAFAYGASGSVSILASLTDSALDLVASMVTFFAVRWAANAPNAAYRFGHGKAESLASLVQSGLVMASAAFIGLEALKRAFRPEPVTSGNLAIVVMAISMALTGWLIWKQTMAVKKTGSIAINGDRAHFTADLAANTVVIIGLVSGTVLNAPGLDATAGLIVAIWLGWGALGLLKSAFKHLVDGSAPEEYAQGVTAAVLEDSRIHNVHQLRTRLSGPTLIAQMHIDLDNELSLIAAHDIVVEAENRILARYPDADIIIHPDPAPRHTDAVPSDDAPLDDIPAPPHPTGPWG